jgi:Sec-independent protein translocase protein TatA
MHILLAFVAGMIAYAVLELLTVIVIVRYFPDKTYALQRLADRIFRTFRKSEYEPEEESEEESEEPTEDYPDEEEERETEEPAPAHPVGHDVVTVDDTEGSYGVVAGTVINNPVELGVAYYTIRTTDGKFVEDVAEDYVADAERIIPEGTPVRFFNEITRLTHNNGVTFKVTVIGGKVVYTVEYPDNNGDVAQVQVASSLIWEKEPEASQAAAPTVQA